MQNNKIDLFWNAKNSSLKVLWGIGDRQRLLRELSFKNNWLLNVQQCSLDWKWYQENFEKVKNEGEYHYAEEIVYNSKNEPVSLIFFNYENFLFFKEVPTDISEEKEVPTDIGISKEIYAMEMCGFYNAT